MADERPASGDDEKIKTIEALHEALTEMNPGIDISLHEQRKMWYLAYRLYHELHPEVEVWYIEARDSGDFEDVPNRAAFEASIDDELGIPKMDPFDVW
jgi:hypothetical protein